MGSHDFIAIIGIALTFLVSVANLFYSLRNNRRTTFVNTVTTSRLKWIDSLRDEVSEFIAVTARLTDSKSPAEKMAELSLKRDTLLHQIALHLNPRDEEDQRIRALADKVRELTIQEHPTKELSAALIDLRDATGDYLKKEWTRVKKESVGEIP